MIESEIRTNLEGVLMKVLFLPLALVIVFQISGTASAQTKPAAPNATAPGKTQPAANKEAERAEAEAEITRLQQRAISLISDAARDAVTLESRRNIARIQSLAGDSIWKYDTERARELFEKAFETAVTHYRETKDEDRETLPSGATVNRTDMRQEVIRAVAKHDPAFAKKLTERFIEEKRREIDARQGRNPDPKSENSLMGKADQGGEQLLRLATTLLETDRQAAIELAQRSVDLSISYGTASFLAQIANRDRRAADELFLFALARIGREQFVYPGQILMIGAYPFGEDRVWISDGSGTSSYGFSRPVNFVLDPVLITRFLTSAAELLARVSQINTTQYPEMVPRVNSGLFAARLLEPKVTQYAPSLLEKWPALLAALHAAATERSREGISQTLDSLNKEKEPLTPTDTGDRVKQALDRAEKTTNFATRDELYAQAAQEARRGGDMSRALSISDKIADFEFRQSVRDWLNFTASSDALSARRIEDAKRYAMEVSATDQRAYLLFQIANALLKDKDRAPAIELLEEAARRASAADNTVEKLRALLGIANSYAAIDPSRAFEVATEAVQVASKVPNYGPDYSRMFRVLKRKDGGSVSVSSSDVEGFDLEKTLAVLAKSDFERALGLAQALESKPLQLLTIVAVAKTLLDK